MLFLSAGDDFLAPRPATERPKRRGAEAKDGGGDDDGRGDDRGAKGGGGGGEGKRGEGKDDDGDGGGDADDDDGAHLPHTIGGFRVGELLGKVWHPNDATR